jgi:2-keto-3-deoxy-L-rhamnonate aldolase RhmA
MAIVPNHALRTLREGGLALGFGVHHLRTVAAPALAAATGHDWLFIDTEHGAFSVHEASQICIAALNSNVTPVVRVCADALDEGTRALDNGAQGLVIPHVSTAKQARRVAEAFRYPPDGHRSWGGPPAMYGYRPPPLAEAQPALNREIMICVMIETPDAVDVADDIAAVNGIDALMIGTSDLSTEMGVPGQIGHDRVRKAYATVAEACERHGKSLGMGGVYDEENASRYIAMGARLVLAGGDHSYIVASGTARASWFRHLPTEPEEPARRSGRGAAAAGKDAKSAGRSRRA